MNIYTQAVPDAMREANGGSLKWFFQGEKWDEKTRRQKGGISRPDGC